VIASIVAERRHAGFWPSFVANVSAGTFLWPELRPPPAALYRISATVGVPAASGVVRAGRAPVGDARSSAAASARHARGEGVRRPTCRWPPCAPTDAAAAAEFVCFGNVQVQHSW